ncbi:TatD family hydrolase [Candidatus Sumerlaeota bacterium]|nr:TatD family hydrolase [Candidatus Sumerlaeota bacterium]
MPAMLFDSHSHLHDKKFNHDRAAAMERAKAAGVCAILALGDTLGRSRDAITLAEHSDMVFAAAGVHPCEAHEWNDESGAALRLLLDHPRVIVLGEIGLDFYWDKKEAALKQQHRAFREQLEIARERRLAVSIHCRESTSAVLDVLEEMHAGDIGGVLHCFSGNDDEARRTLRLGFHIGVGGTSTYPKSQALRDTIRKAGLDNLLIETDAPYLAPQVHRGKRNEPAFVADTASALAATLGVTVGEVAEKTWGNTLKAFRLAERGVSIP